MYRGRDVSVMEAEIFAVETEAYVEDVMYLW